MTGKIMKLINVKSIVTIALTVVFAALSLKAKYQGNSF